MTKVKINITQNKENIKWLKKHVIDLNNGSSCSSIYGELLEEYIKKNS